MRYFIYFICIFSIITFLLFSYESRKEVVYANMQFLRCIFDKEFSFYLLEKTSKILTVNKLVTK